MEKIKVEDYDWCSKCELVEMYNSLFDLYKQALKDYYEQSKINEDHQELNGMLREENKRLKELYQRTCKHLFDIGNDELARYFQAQINECNTFTVENDMQ